MHEYWTRRSVLAGAGLIALGSFGRAWPRVAGDPPAGMPDLSVPENNLWAVIRVQASLREEDVPWWYNGTIYGIVGDEQPRPLFGFEGMELYWMRRLGELEYELIGNTLTFFRDLDTGEFLESWRNPWTGERVAVAPAVQGGGPGRGFNYSPRGIRFTRAMDQIPDQPLQLNWTFARDQVWLHNETAYPPGMAPPRAQRQSMFVPAAAFADPGIPRLPTVFSSTVFMPWLRWMGMGERPGHVVWHAAGAKLESIAQLPTEYRTRAERDYPQYLTADPSVPREPPGAH